LIAILVKKEPTLRSASGSNPKVARPALTCPEEGFSAIISILAYGHIARALCLPQYPGRTCFERYGFAEPGCHTGFKSLSHISDGGRENL
jgi:hypothetical protein